LAGKTSCYIEMQNGMMLILPLTDLLQMHVCVYLWVIGDVESLDQENHRGRRPHRCTAGSHSVCKCLSHTMNNSVIDVNGAILICGFDSFNEVST